MSEVSGQDPRPGGVALVPCSRQLLNRIEASTIQKSSSWNFLESNRSQIFSFELF